MAFSGANQLLTGLPASALLADFSSIVVFTEADTQWWAEVDTADPTKSRWANAAKNQEYAFDCCYFNNGTTQKTAIYRVRHFNISSTVAPQLRSYPPKASRASYAAGDAYGQYNAYDDYWEAYYTFLDLNDRTRNGKTLSLYGDASLASSDGYYGGALSLDGSGDYAEGASITAKDVTVITTHKASWSYGDGVSPQLYRNVYNNKLSMTQGITTGSWANTPEYYATASTQATGDNTQWNFLAGGIADVGAFLYANGAEIAGTYYDSTPIVENTCVNRWGFGRYSGSITGLLGPVSFHSAIRSIDWVSYEYSQTSANSSFWTRTSWDDGGTETTTNALTGMLSAAPGLSGPLGVSARLAGLLDTLETLDADLSVLASLGGNLGESPEISGGLDVAARLSGNLEAAPGVAGTLHVSIPLSGACESLPGLVGSLSVTIEGENLLSGNLSAASQLSGQLSVRAPLTGILATDPDFTGELTSELRNQLEGALQAAAEALGTLSVKVPLSGAMEADPELSGELTGGKILVMEGAIASAPVQFGIIGTAPVSFGAIANAKIKGRWE